MAKKIFAPLECDVISQHKNDLAIEPNYHSHDGYEIFLFLRGDVNYYVEQQCYRLKRGNVLVMRPGEYHRVELLNGEIYERIVCNFRTSFFDALPGLQTDLSKCFWDRPLGEQNVALMNESQIKDFTILSKEMGTTLGEEQEYGQDVMLMAYALQTLVKINRLFLKLPGKSMKNIMPVMIAEIMQYVEEHLTEPITLQDLADYCYHNKSYISKKFRHTTGISIQQYIISKRIELSKMYLMEGKDLTEACLMSGFNDYSNFARTFTKWVGCSPKKFQKMNRA